MFNFHLFDILCAWIRLPFEKLWPFEFLESFGCSISSVWIYYAPESDFSVTSYDHLNFSRAFVVQFRASRYNKRQNRTFVWQVMTIWISRELPVSIQSISISDASESDFCKKSYDRWNFSRASDVQFLESRYIMCLNRTSVWQVMTIWISRDQTLFNFECVDILGAWIGRPCDKLWPFEFLDCFRCSI